ncbi:MAG: SDR family NAD(P)-dependent oxidoreductase [Kibdelosporangium sp.]
MNKTVIVTGASAGVGAAAARKFAELGATVAVVGRSAEKTTAVAREIGAKPYIVDFSGFDDVRKVAEELRADHPVVDILANNAGMMVRTPTLSRDGHELTFQVNYLAPFLLTALLRDQLEASPEARVISTSSAAHAYGSIDLDRLGQVPERYSTMRAYGASKLGNILFTQELARRAKATSITASSFHPGPVVSDFFREGRLIGTLANSALAKAVLFTPDRGAEPLLHLATVSDPRSVDGAYFDKRKRREPKGQARDADFARRLWDRTAELLGVSDQADR